MPIEQNWTWIHNDIGTFDLNAVAWNITTFSGRTRMAPRRGENSEVTYRDGTLWTPKDYAENEIELAMWIIGCNEDGTIPDDPSAQFWANLKKLQRAFVTDRVMGFLQYTHPIENKAVIATCEVRERIDFTTMAGATRAAFIVRMHIPGVWFRDVNYFGESVSTSRANLATWDVDLDSDVMVKDPLLTLTGGVAAATNPKLYNLSLSGASNWAQYAGVVAPGQVLVIDPKTWRVTLDAVKVTGALVWSGQPQFFWLRNGINQIKLETDNAIGVKVQGKGAYW